MSLIGGIQFLHDFLHLLFSRLLDAHFLCSQHQYLLQLIALDTAIAVDVDHVEGCLIDTVYFILVLYQLIPHYFKTMLMPS